MEGDDHTSVQDSSRLSPDDKDLPLKLCIVCAEIQFRTDPENQVLVLTIITLFGSQIIRTS